MAPAGRQCLLASPVLALPWGLSICCCSSLPHWNSSAPQGWCCPVLALCGPTLPAPAASGPAAVELLHNLQLCSSPPSRLHQAVKLYLFSSFSGGFNCPLAMTDGAAKVIEV